MRLGAILLFLGMLALPLQSLAFVYIVDDTADLVDSNLDDGSCNTSANTCTLRAAIQQANAWPGHHTIVLPAGTFELEIAGRGENDAATGDLDIRDHVTIRGAGAGQTIIDANAIDRIFHIHPNARVEISGVTLTGGRALPRAAPNSDEGRGGAIHNLGTLTLRDSIISSNRSHPAFGAAGGGIYHFANNDNALSLLLERVTVSNNEADNTPEGSGFTGSTFPVNGGGLSIQGGLVEISDSVISGNLSISPGSPNAAEGGGIHINGARVTIDDSTISGNTANFHGGGIWNFSSPGPGNGGGELTISNSTISNNTAYQGGGIYHDGGTGIEMRIINSTLSGNATQSGIMPPPTAGGALYLRSPARLESTTISNNTSGSGDAIFINDQTSGSATLKHVIIDGTCNGDGLGAITSLGHNISQGNCALNGPGDQPATNANLGTLAGAQGGPTAVHVPNPGSPAIDTGDNGACPTIDQRHFPRPVDGGTGNATCDIGAIEVTPGTFADLAVMITDAPDPVAVGETLTWTVTVTNHGPNDATGANLTFSLPGAVNSVNDPDGCANGCGLGTIAAGDSVIRTIEASPTAVGILEASASATANQADPNPINNTGIMQTTEAYIPVEMTITTSAETTGTILRGQDETTGTIEEGDTIVAGERFTYTLSISPDVDARNVVIRDTLPNLVTLHSSTPSTGSCSTSNRIVTCNLGDIGGGSTETIALAVTANGRGTLTNRADANFDGVFTGPAPSSTFVIEATTIADTAVSMSTGSSTVLVGADLGYTTVVRNHGPSVASDLVLVFELDETLDYTGVSSGGWSCVPNDTNVTCSRGTLNANAQSTVTVFTSPTVTGQVTSTATISSDDTDPVPGNNIASTTTTVQAGALSAPNLSVTLSDNPAPVIVGNNVRYTATVSNIGSDRAANVTATYTLPSSAVFVGAQAGCGVNGDFVICNMATINANESANSFIDLRAEQVGEIEVSVTALDSEGRDTDLSNNSATRVTAVNEVPGAGPSSGSGCFIATAAWGSYLDPQVGVLRAFRDDYLLTNTPGRAFVSWYYRVSPPIADVIAGSEALRTATRWALTPLVWAAQYPAATLALLGLLLLGGIRRVRSA